MDTHTITHTHTAHVQTQTHHYPQRGERQQIGMKDNSRSFQSVPTGHSSTSSLDLHLIEWSTNVKSTRSVNMSLDTGYFLQIQSVFHVDSMSSYRFLRLK